MVRNKSKWTNLISESVKELLGKKSLLKKMAFEYNDYLDEDSTKSEMEAAMDDLEISCEFDTYLDDNSVTCSIKVNEDEELARFDLAELFGCCGVCVLSDLTVETDDHLNKGLGTLLHGIALDIMRDDGYSYAVCTDVMTNRPSMKLLRKYGWKKTGEFINNRTGRTIGVFGLDLSKVVRIPVKKKLSKKVVKKVAQKRR